MKRLLLLSAAAALGLCVQSTAHAYNATATVTFTWAGAGTQIGWTSSGVNTFPDLTDNPSIEVFTAGGSNSTTYFNADFAAADDYDVSTTDDDCLTPLPNFETISLRKYSCRHSEPLGYYTPDYNPVPIADQSGGGSASGTLTATDTTLTGTLTVVSTTDEPTGATTTFSGTVRTSSSTGDGFDGYNVRTADGSPFGNAWYGVTTAATLTVNLTGTFTTAAWTINGGGVTFRDSGFACQQGGFGGSGAGTLCTPSVTGGGFTTVGGNLSWGMDPDGGGTGSTSAIGIDVREVSGTSTIVTLGGVLASLTIDGAGAITTTQGEYRSALGSSGGGCSSHIRWGGDTDPFTAGDQIGINCGTLSAGPLVIAGTATEIVPDGDPDPFTFIDVTGVATSTLITSDPVTITGISTAAAISVTGGEYSVGCTATYTTTAGTVNNNDEVCVRHTSAATPSTATNTDLTVGSVSDTFTSTTVASDTTPDAFSFTSQANVALSTVITSNAVAISGINVAAAVTVANGEYSVGCTGTFVSTAGTINNAETVCVRHTSSANFSTNTVTTLTIGGVDGTFTTTTLAQDTTPDAFSFATQSNVAPSTQITSAAATIAGINSAAAVTVANGTYSVGCTATYVATAGTINNGETVCVRHTSSAAFSTNVVTTLTIGGVNGTFTSTTLAADTTPDAFPFNDAVDVEVATLVTSNAVAIGGINTASPISVTGGEYSIGCNATFTAAAGTITNGETVCVRHTSAADPNTDTETTLTIGGIASIFTSTTAAGGLRADDGGSSLDLLVLSLLGLGGLWRRRSR